MKPASAPAARSPRAAVASFRLRILFRGVFVLLATATIALAIVLLQDEKERSYRSYEEVLRETHAEVLSRLRQPSGMLALLNPHVSAVPPLRPLLLPFPALDFDDQTMVHQAVEQAGCSVRYPDDSRLCAAVGASARAAGFLYLVGSFRAGQLVGRDAIGTDVEAAHRLRIQIDAGEDRKSWIAPLERLSAPDEPPVHGSIVAFEIPDPTAPATGRPVREFRGTVWQSAGCAAAGSLPDCPRRVLFALRLPVKSLREAAGPKSRPVWPPPDLERIRVHLAVLAPGEGPALFDSNAAGAEPPRSLAQAVQSLRAGETLSISPQDPPGPAVVLKGVEAAHDRSSPLLLRLVSGLPVALPTRPIALRDTVVTPVGGYEVRLAGDVRAVDAGLGAIASRISWYVSAMLAAIALAWVVIELGLIRRITALSRRAVFVSHGVWKNARGGERIGQLDVSDLRGPDELGILAGGLADLLQRVKDDVEREELRARQEREMLEAVGHEILSPLQSLMVLFPDADQPAHRYVQRMRQAVGALYGQSSPREALQAAQLQLVPVDLDEFLSHIAANAEFAGIRDVHYERLGRRVMVLADEFPLEDVVTHILRNADRHRAPDTPIVLSLVSSGKRALVRVHNIGAGVDETLLGRIFDYGVRDAEDDAADIQGRRGQGLFVARTYMAKMAGTVSARNEEGGVAFYLDFPLGA